MSEVKTLELKRTYIMLESEKLEYVSCAEIGLYLCYRQKKLVYDLVRPAIGFLLWANGETHARIDQLDLAMLEDKGITIVTYKVLDGKPDFRDTLDQLNKHTMISEHDAKDRIIILPYADERPGDEVFYHPVVMRIKADEDAVRD